MVAGEQVKTARNQDSREKYSGYSKERLSQPRYAFIHLYGSDHKKWAIMPLKVSYTADKLIARILMKRPLRFFLSF